ncbi:hypothetical protein E2C01_048363 [Portunus trituberculatus]|uniref:Uncharacterized protein n=1 Tax=Portunus trituberculatus TaxID=210409 RepID=A0A5B7GAC6_PORTR|nr:hypothetical protein [Portunus trituberculatus]
MDIYYMGHLGQFRRSDTLGIAWKVPGEYHGNGNNKQQHCNAPQNVNLMLNNHRIEKLPCRSFYHDRTRSMRNTEEGGKKKTLHPTIDGTDMNTVRVDGTKEEAGKSAPEEKTSPGEYHRDALRNGQGRFIRVRTRGGGVVEKVVSVGLGRRPPVDSNPTKYGP